MKRSDLPASPPDPLLPRAIPVICDKCRAEGMAGDDAFAGIPDVLAFDPVPRRAHVNNWTPEHQRAFIAALALTGSPTKAARALGRHAFGAEQLRKARGGRSFSDAWEAALDIARERELARIHGNLRELAAEADNAAPVFAAEGATDEDEAAAGEALRDELFRKFMRLRRQGLREIAGDPEQRRAQEVIEGRPLDWERIVNGGEADRWWESGSTGPKDAERE